MTFKYFGASALVLVALLQGATVSAQTSDTLQKIKDSGVINLGGRDASLPFSYKPSASDDPIGYSVDLCMKVVEAVKAKLNLPQLKVQYTVVTPTNRLPLVLNGTIDLECGTTTNTVARAQQVDFTPTIFVSRIGAAVKKSSGIKSISDLDGKTIATVSGSTAIQLLRTYRRNEKAEIFEISAKDTAETFLLLSSDRASAMVLDDVLSAGLIANSRSASSYRLLPESLRDEPFGFMFRKGDPKFRELVEQTIRGVMKSGEINEIYAKWFTRPIPPHGVNLDFPMSSALREAIQNPSNKGI
jgi:glutamate/aspartate transport system substrate-binding protein